MAVIMGLGLLLFIPFGVEVGFHAMSKRLVELHRHRAYWSPASLVRCQVSGLEIRAQGIRTLRMRSLGEKGLGIKGFGVQVLGSKG